MGAHVAYIHGARTEPPPYCLPRPFHFGGVFFYVRFSWGFVAEPRAVCCVDLGAC